REDTTMHTIDLTNEWWLQDDGIDVLLTGPGNVEIVVPDFDARRLLHEEGLGPDLLGTLRQLSWTYPLEGSELQVVSTWDTTRPAHPPRHLLHVGPAVAWVLPDAVGQRLQGWLARCEEGTERPDLPRGDGGVRPGRAPVESADPQALRAALVQGQQ